MHPHAGSRATYFCLAVKVRGFATLNDARRALSLCLLGETIFAVGIDQSYRNSDTSTNDAARILRVRSIKGE